jgi:hypothetical protein
VVVAAAEPESETSSSDEEEVEPEVLVVTEAPPPPRVSGSSASATVGPSTTKKVLKVVFWILVLIAIAAAAYYGVKRAQGQPVEPMEDLKRLWSYVKFKDAAVTKKPHGDLDVFLDKTTTAVASLTTPTVPAGAVGAGAVLGAGAVTSAANLGASSGGAGAGTGAGTSGETKRTSETPMSCEAEIMKPHQPPAGDTSKLEVTLPRGDTGPRPSSGTKLGRWTRQLFYPYT